jgi:type III secretion protein U
MSESGEKTLPPSDKKLRDARKNGQLAHSKDMPTAVSLIACLAVVATSATYGLKTISGSIISSLSFSEKTFQQRAIDSVIELGSFMGQFVGSAVAAAIGAVILSHIIVMRGFIFTLHPMSQGLNKLNPVTNLKQIFGINALSELIKSILKVVVLGGVLAIVIQDGILGALNTPFCGLNCQIALAGHLALNILIVGSFILLVLGGVDILLQNWMFNRDMMMTFDEQKRERKEQDGSPEIKQEQGRLRREAIMGDPIGAKNATIFLSGDGDVVIGISYVKGKTPVPVLVYRSPKLTSAELHAEHPSARLYRSASLHATLMAEGKIGKMIPKSTFDSSARMLYALSMI